MKTGFAVRDVMSTNVLSIDAMTPIQNVAQLMKTENIGSLLVTVEDHSAGIVTQEDIVHKLVALGGDLNTPVRNIMSSPIISIKPTTDIFDAIVLMNKHRIRHLPVMEEEMLKGYLTIKDVLRVEPELLQLAHDIFWLREEQEKPIGKHYETGECDGCANESDQLLEIRQVLLCTGCRTALRPVME